MWGRYGRSIARIRLYARNTGKPWSATAIAQPHQTPETYQATYIDRSTRVAKLLDLDTVLEPGDIDTLTGYAGTKYGVPSEAAYAAIHLVAKTEAIILDPNYTGKSMSALIAQIRTRNLDPKNPHNLHPHRRPTPNLRLPQPTLQPRTPIARRRDPSGRPSLSRSEANAGDARGGWVEPVEPSRHSRERRACPRQTGRRVAPVYGGNVRRTKGASPQHPAISYE